MKDKLKDKLANALEYILVYGFISLVILAVIGLISTSIYCWCTYGGKPITDIPSWALWFMFGGGK